MTTKSESAEVCSRCTDAAGRRGFGHPVSMAFQPIVDLEDGAIFAHEALVRTPEGGGAGEVMSLVNDENRYGFDQKCRVTAIRLAAELGLTETLSINFMPNAVHDPELCLRTTIWAAENYGFPIERIVFEFTEDQRLLDPARLREMIRKYRIFGLRTAIDDFGAGYSGLALLADLQPDFIKIDMALVRGIESDPVRQEIVAAIAEMTRGLGVRPIAEGVETAGELRALRDLGIRLVQGFLIARPAFETLARVERPTLARMIAA